MWSQQLKQRLDGEEEEKSEDFKAEDQEHDGNIQINSVYSLSDQQQTSVVPADVQELVQIKEEAPEEQKPDVNHWDQEHLHIKKEEEELWSSLGAEKLNVKEETDVTSFTFTAVPLKHEDDEDKPLFLQLHQHQAEVRDLPTSSSAENLESTTGGESCGGAETTRNPDLSTHEDDSDSSETEVREDDEEENVNNSDSQLKHLADSGSITDKDHESSPCRVSETGIKTNKNVQKLHSCDLCGRKFSQKGHLNRHVRIHSGQRPFCCELCGQSFTLKGHLDRHMRIHTGQKPFCCELCGRNFTEKSNLNAHMMIHTGQQPFCCELCGRKFNTKSNLNTHKRLHTGLKPYWCELCDQRFTEKVSLNVHIRMHRGQKPFRCELCGKGCLTNSSLKKHIQIHTEKAVICNDS